MATETDPLTDEIPRHVITRRYLATYTGRSEFYSGLTPGSRVVVREEVTLFTYADRLRANVGLSAAVVRDDGREPGPWLSLYDHVDQLTDIEELEG